MKKILDVKIYIIIFLILPYFTFAGNEHTPLVPIPGVEGDVTLTGIIQALFTILISLAALLAVLKLIIAGAKYMMSDVVTNKQSAISDIKGAIFGLILVLSTIVILNVINTNIANTSVQLGSGATQSE